MTTIHNSTHQVTLTPKTPSLTITGTIDAIGPAGTYAAYTLQSAVFATAPTDATIKNTGTILSTATAGTDFAIVLGGAGTITNTGFIKAASGIFANGPATIKNAGTIKDLSNALTGTGIDMNAGGTLDNTATGLISAGTIGVFASTGQITNVGTIKAAYDAIATTGGADIANAGLLEGEIGIAAASGAHITNTGKILVTTTGVFLDGSSVLNAGLISGGADGILQFNGYASVTNAAAGTISAKNQAISLYAGTVHNAGLIRAAQGIVIDETGAATNTGTISVTGYGIHVQIAGDTVQNAGLITVTGTGGNGVVLDVNDTLSNTGTITGQYHGIYITQYKSGAASAPGQITNAGLIAAAQPAYTDFAGTTLISAAIFDRGAATITNLAHATISDTAGIGITVAGYKIFGAAAPTYLPATILNAGAITALYAINLAAPGAIQNTGTITGTRDAIITNASPDSIYNTGLIATTGSFFSTNGTSERAEAVIMNQTGTITNAAAGTIAARYTAVILKSGGAVTNHGLMDGVALYGPGYVLNTGRMTAANDIEISGGPGTVKNTGTLTATYADGIDLAGGGIVTNTGLIQGRITLGAAASIHNTGDITGQIVASGSAAVTMTNAAHATIGTLGRASGVDIINGYLSNAGLITGNGVQLSGTVINTGTIWSNDEAAEQGTGLSGGAVLLTNSGTINGADEGIQTGGRLNLTNTGTIEGGDNAILAQYGGTIYNAGLIKNTDTAAPAIELDAGTGFTSLLIIAPTSTIIGSAAVSGELSLATGTGTISFAQFDVFETLALSAGATWQATGTINHQALITNAGTLNAGTGTGITLARGGTIKNFGLITGGSGRVGATGLTVATSIYGKSNVIYNAGIIAAYGAGNGIELGAATTLINAASGLISGFNGIVIAAGTVINDGTILSPQTGYAVAFTQQNAANRLILGTASDTQGYINLDSGTLELQAGTTTGNFSTRIANMAAVVVDKHAAWALETGIIAATITNNGTLIATPHKDAAVSGTLTGTGTVAIESGYFEMNGAAAATQKFDFSQPGGTLSLITPQNFSATIEHFTLGDTIDLAGISLSSITATHFVAGTLTLSEATTSLQFTFANPAAFTGKTFALSAAPGATVITLAAASPNLLPTPTPTSPAPLITLGS